MTLHQAVTHYTHHRKKAEQCGCTAIRDKFDLSSADEAYRIVRGRKQHPDAAQIRELYAEGPWHIKQAGNTRDIAKKHGVSLSKVQKMVQRERGSL